LGASVFKCIGGASIANLGANFFTQVYSGYDKQYSIANAFVAIGGGIPSAFIGGFFGDYFESEKGGKRLYMKGYLSGFGALIACIFVVLCFLIQINFWISISSLFFVTLFAEVWPGNTISIINKIFPSNS
jgi:MFS family permease